ncbi:ATP-binding protein [Streptomyces sp. ZAF1911]|uniref:ATP-binding protein n=1 Tax=Streptomyces sp. ZAF1911 TaxID=2944129 RepID=UPI00237AA9D9|nr:ATP-binding protein [Streptomyces sp. ZAF1911]MDD9375903.1 ATP-binding protein [Streptomyces sp. ZAF1911]
MPDLVDAAVRIDSELVTNALRHGTRPVWHTLRQVLLADGGLSVHIVVGDRGEGWEIRSGPATAAAKGTTVRGLDVVATLAVAWGATRSYAGHLVWADLRVGQQRSPGSGSPRTWTPTEWRFSRPSDLERPPGVPHAA